MDNTPRAEQNRIPNSELSDWGVGLSDYVDIELSRGLELELNDAKAEIKRLNELLDANTVHSCGDHCQRPACKRAMRNAIAEAIPFLESHKDEGPSPYGWQSDELRNLVEKLKHFIQ